MFGVRPEVIIKEIKDDVDKKFDLMSRKFDRIGKVLRAIDFQLIVVDQKINRLEQRKNERIIGGKSYMKNLKKLRKIRDVRQRHKAVVAARKSTIVNNE